MQPNSRINLTKKENKLNNETINSTPDRVIMVRISFWIFYSYILYSVNNIFLQYSMCKCYCKTKFEIPKSCCSSVKALYYNFRTSLNCCSNLSCWNNEPHITVFLCMIIWKQMIGSNHLGNKHWINKYLCVPNPLIQ